MSNTTIRWATAADAGALVHLIKELAEYEKEPNAATATEDVLALQMAQETPPFECLLADQGGEVVGMALFVPNYSTWKARPGMWLEDFYVTPKVRGQKVGLALFERLKQIAAERAYGRIEFSVLNWNELAHGFYRRQGCTPNEGWTSWRLDLP